MTFFSSQLKKYNHLKMDLIKTSNLKNTTKVLSVCFFILIMLVITKIFDG